MSDAHHDHVDLHHHWPDRPLDVHVHLHDESSGRVILEKLDQLLTLVRAVQAQGMTLMATQQELSDELDAIKTAVDEVKATGQAQVAEIAALKAQIAAGTPVSQEQLDSLDAKADSILASLGAPPA
jgi:hypothetical protein